MTPAQQGTLEALAWAPDGEGLWWHDLPYPTRDTLHANGWIREVGRERCNGHGRAHPGYVTISDAGIRALAAAGSHIGLSLARTLESA